MGASMDASPVAIDGHRNPVQSSRLCLLFVRGALRQCVCLHARRPLWGESFGAPFVQGAAQTSKRLYLLLGPGPGNTRSKQVSQQKACASEVEVNIRNWISAFAMRTTASPKVSTFVARPFLRGSALPTAKCEKEIENKSYSGGLRNPNKAVAKSPALQNVGAKARQALEDLGRDAHLRKQILEIIQKLGTPSCEGFPAEILEVARQSLRKCFGLDSQA